ncbi:uncharacterized protein LOC130363089 [Hyla sarda]|uniref:uncharacterized protein LOC130363089 n=1 Tax=Hyla sarda TaxID=327740 RepID=UPI0024C45CA1|nr:uncharacterized protein LOC130363089 [Hyla sarda]
MLIGYSCLWTWFKFCETWPIPQHNIAVLLTSSTAEYWKRALGDLQRHPDCRQDIELKMKTAVFIVCLIGMACALPYSSESHSKSISESHPDSSSSSSSSSEERFRTAPTVNTATVQSIITEDFPRGDSLRLRRALKGSSESSPQDTSSIESHTDSSSSSEEVRTVPTPDETTLIQARGDSFRRRRALEQTAHGSTSHYSEESVTTESTSHQSHPTESSEEDSHEHNTTNNLLQGILSVTTADPDTSEESSEERTTPVLQP